MNELIVLIHKQQCAPDKSLSGVFSAMQQEGLLLTAGQLRCWKFNEALCSQTKPTRVVDERGGGRKQDGRRVDGTLRLNSYSQQVEMPFLGVSWS